MPSMLYREGHCQTGSRAQVGMMLYGGCLAGGTESPGYWMSAVNVIPGRSLSNG